MGLHLAQLHRNDCTSLPSTEQGDRPKPLVAGADSERQEAVASLHPKATRHGHLDNGALDRHVERERKQVQVWSGYNIVGASYLVTSHVRRCGVRMVTQESCTTHTPACFFTHSA